MAVPRDAQLLRLRVLCCTSELVPAEGGWDAETAEMLLSRLLRN